MAMLQYPEQVGRDLVLRASQTKLANRSLAVVRDGIAASIDAFGSRGWLDRVIAEVPAPFAGLVKELGMAPLPERADRELTTYCQGVTVSLIERDLLARKADRLGQLQRTDPKTEPEQYRAIQRDLIGIEAERRALRHD